jgi:hypothetical protein
MHSLSRTFTGKTTHYSPDGYGRDWYILHNNGGVYKKGCVTGFSNEKSSPKREYSPPQPRMQAKFTRYSSDGSGRDAYINSNSGGLLYQYGAKPFHTTLRNWSPIKSPDQNDMLFQTQQQWLRRRARKNSVQEDLNKRLSVPKKKEVESPLLRSIIVPKKVPYPKNRQ